MSAAPCFRCGTRPRRSEGRQSLCLVCHAEDMRDRAARNRQKATQ